MEARNCEELYAHDSKKEAKSVEIIHNYPIDIFELNMYSCNGAKVLLFSQGTLVADSK